MKKYSTEEIYPKSQTGKCMIYFNMSHHYRRIYSAKPRIDTNLIKKPQAQLCCSSPDVFNFVKRSGVKQPLLMTPRHKICTKEKDSDLFKPKILDSHAESKLKSMPVYQAPQRILSTKSVQTENSNEKLIIKQVEKDNQENAVGNIDLNNQESNLKSIQNINNKCKSQTCQQRWEDVDGNKKFSRPLDKSTVLFLKDITDDILMKGIYSNQSLEKLFKHHLSKNKYFLPKDIMEKEILRLKRELEMPEHEERSSQETVKDEDALTALDSLLLPSDIRDKVASSLGLTRKLQLPLPSPKDSFTGSLELTSLSNKIDEENQNKNVSENGLANKQIRSDLEQLNDGSKEDTTHDAIDNLSSNKTSVHSIGSNSPQNTDKTNEIPLSVNLTETISPALEENNYDDNSKLEDLETSSDMSSIYTE